MLEAFLTSTMLVAVAEIGDKTQLLSFALAGKLRQPRAIIAGILTATLLNHALAGSVGVWISQMLSASTLRLATATAFAGFGLWALLPDRLDDEPEQGTRGAFVTTTIAFFFAEMGDKTQLATIALGSRFDSLTAVVIGTTLGMMIANVPAVILGEKLAHRIPARLTRRLAAILFLLTALWTWYALAPEN